MIVKEEIREKWKSLFRRGDYQAIADGSGYSKDAIRNAFRGISVGEDIVVAIHNYFQKVKRKRSNDNRKIKPLAVR